MRLWENILLQLSYLIVALVVAFLAPAVMGVTATEGYMLGLAIFVIAGRVETLIRRDGTADVVGEAEDVLQSNFQEMKAEFAQKTEAVEAKNDKLIAELKLLQTLLGQVVRKEKKLRGLDNGDSQQPGGPQADRPATTVAAREVDEAAAEASEVSEASGEDEFLVSETALEGTDAYAIGDPEKSGGDVAISGVGAPEQRTGQIGSGKQRSAIRVIKKDSHLLSVITAALSENRVDLYLQPIVALPSRRVVHYECYSRVRDEDGNIILPRHYMKLAEEKGLIGTLDNLLLFRLIQLVRRLGKRRSDVRFFCNMSHHSLNDREFFPQFVEFMTANHEFAQRLVFEIPQNDYQLIDDPVKDRLHTLGRRGFAFSLDRVDNFSDNFPGYGDHQFRFAKADLADLITQFPDDEFRSFKSALRRAGIQLIGSRVETEDSVLKALDMGLEYAQGYLFAEPAEAGELNRVL